MPPTGDCAAFAFRDATTSVGDVVRAGYFRGELQASAFELAWKTACEDEAERLSLDADEVAVGAMIDRFRYENDLISAEETEAWLDSRGLTADEVQAYFERCNWRETLGEKVVAGKVDLSRVTPELLGELQVELLMSGAFGPLATGLARRLVARSATVGPGDAGQVEAERARFLARSGLDPERVAGWLANLERGEEWLGRMLEMEASYRLTCAAVLTPGRLSQALAAARLPLTRLEVETVEFDSADAAREGHLCVRDDGLSLEEVSRESRYPFKRLEFLAEDLPEERRQKLLCAGIGEVMEPVSDSGVFHLSRVLGKAEPNLADPSVRRRVEQRILDTYFSEAGAKDIRWIIL